MPYRKVINLFLLLTCFFSYSCKKYLNKTLAADVTENQVFSTFPTFQGFIERLYCDIIDFGTMSRVGTQWNYGDDIWCADVYNQLIIGNTAIAQVGGDQSQYHFTDATFTRGCTPFTSTRGIWNNGWAAIRDCNAGLAHFNILQDATDEEKDLLKGQLYFFRGYFHWQIMKQWGNIPYSDTLLVPGDVMRIPQLSMFATGEKVLADLQKAALLLPVDWDATTIGQATLGINRGRLTKGMAYSFMAEAQLWLGSPLMNGVQTGSYTYNTDYCKKAASSAWKVIELANKGTYALNTWANYGNLFKTDNRTEPGTSKEIIFKAPYLGENSRFHVGSAVLPAVGGDGRFFGVTQNYVELFETSKGLPIDDPASAFNAADPWSNRDPRFKNAVYVDQDRIVENRNDELGFAQFYTGGRDRGASSSQTAFGMRKFLFTSWNKFDNKWGANGNICVPILRLAEIYLFYAEAANEGYGSPTEKDPDANLTALDAVNLVRARATMPQVNDKFLSKTEFRERVRNERAVELCFEAKRRDDLRRWHIATQPKYRDLYSCEFPQDHTSFRNQFIMSIVFDREKYYWFAYPAAQVLLYPEWKQNIGW